MKIETRTVGEVHILDCSGKITLGEGTMAIRNTVRAGQHLHNGHQCWRTAEAAQLDKEDSGTPGHHQAADGVLGLSGRAGGGCELLAKEFIEFHDLREIVENDKSHQEDQENESRLNDFLLDPQAQIASDQGLHKEEGNDSSIQDRNGEQVENAKLKANQSKKSEENASAARPGGAPGNPRNLQRPRNGFYGCGAGENPTDDLEGQRRHFIVPHC